MFNKLILTTFFRKSIRKKKEISKRVFSFAINMIFMKLFFVIYVEFKTVVAVR
jgi:hypothetical protein